MDPDEQSTLFKLEEPWRAEWRGMPDFTQEDLTPYKSIIIHFATPGDMALFASLMDQTVTPQTQSLWHPAAEIGHMVNKRFIEWG